MSHPPGTIPDMSRRPRTFTPKIVDGDPPRYWSPFQHGWYCATHDERLIMPPPLSKYDRLYSKRKPRPPWCVSCRREEAQQQAAITEQASPPSG